MFKVISPFKKNQFKLLVVVPHTNFNTSYDFILNPDRQHRINNIIKLVLGK